MPYLNKNIVILVGITPYNLGKEASILSDDELIKKILETNDSMLFGKLYDRYGEKVYFKCYSFVRNEDDAKDLAQDIFLKLFTKLGTYRAESKFSTWLYSFTYNFLVNHKKRDSQKKLGERWQRLNKLDNHLAAEDDIEEEELFVLKSATLEKALQLIEPADKALLLLKYQDGVLVKDIQTLLHINESAVKMRLKRARIKLMSAYTKIKNDKEKPI